MLKPVPETTGKHLTSVPTTAIERIQPGHGYQLVSSLLQARKLILATCLTVAAMTFALVYFFTEPTQTAELSFYITHDNSLAPEQMLENGSQLFGDRAEVEFHLLHLRSFGTSGAVLASVADSLDLAKHYGYSGEMANDDAAERLYQNVSVELTTGQELCIKVNDRDLSTALAIAHCLMRHINRMNNAQLEERLAYMDIVSTEQLAHYQSKRTEITDSLQRLERELTMSLDLYLSLLNSSQRAGQANPSGLQLATKGQYLLHQLDRIDEQVANYENHLTKNEIARQLIQRKQPLVVRQSSPHSVSHHAATASMWGGASMVWVLLSFALFYWCRLAYLDYQKAWQPNR